MTKIEMKRIEDFLFSNTLEEEGITKVPSVASPIITKTADNTESRNENSKKSFVMEPNQNNAAGVPEILQVL